MSRLVSVSIALAVLCIASTVSAQSYIGIAPDLTIDLQPEYPAPGETVRVRARSTVMPLADLPIRWTEGGKTTLEGIGEVEKSVVAGALGSETIVRVSVVFEEEVHTALAYIRPAQIDLLWEADSYTPPFFRGRALPSAGTNMRFEALPHFTRPNGSPIASRDIIFTWSRDGYVIPGTSGRGRSSARIPAPSLFGTDTISVEAKSADGAYVHKASVQIPSQEPRLVLYENHPLFGIMFNNAIDAQEFLDTGETSLSATPYYADALHPDDPGLLYEWRVNGTTVQNNPERPSSLTINAAGSSGSARVELSLSHALNIFQSAVGSWNISLLGEGGGGADDPFRNP